MWRRRLKRGLLLYPGLAIGGFSLTLFVRADLGLDPWDVLHQGLSQRSGISLGVVVALSSAAVLVMWIPLRQRPGLGTLADVVVIAVVIDLTMPLISRPETMAGRTGFLLGALALNGLSTSMYVGAGLGPGPRDGLMTGLAARGLSLRGVRVAIDASVLTGGWLLGGTVGIGTIASAVTMGPIVHALLPWFSRWAAESNSSEPGRHRSGVRPAVATDPC